jgi:hypothetical protein
VPEPPQELASRTAHRERKLLPQQLMDGILRGDRTILARAITLIESSRATDRELAERIVEDCLKYSGNSLRVGVTGVPGAGKSSIIEVLGSHLIGSCRQKVAVLAIDPSSQLSGGSILGDKTRMEPSFGLHHRVDRWAELRSARARPCFCARPPDTKTSWLKPLEWDNRRPRFMAWWISSC